MRFYQFVLRNLRRRLVRSLLTAGGMAVAVGAVVALVGISRGFERSFLAVYEQQRVDLVVQQAGSRQRLTSALDESLAAKIAAIPGVETVNYGLVDFISMEGAGALGVLVQGWPPDSTQLTRLVMLSGRRYTAADSGVVLLGKTLARNLQLKVGDSFVVFEGTEPFTVLGTFEGDSVLENGMMVMPLRQLQKFMGREGQVSGFTVNLTEPRTDAKVEEVRHAIEALAPNLAAAPVREFVRETSELQVVRAMSWVTSAIALVIGAVGMLNTMIMSVFERTKEIGILRAIGWRKTRIVRMILTESLILSLAGGVAGTVGAVLLTQFLAQLPAAAGYVSAAIPPAVVFQGMAIAVVVGVLGAAYPAWRSTQLDPTEALRHE